MSERISRDEFLEVWRLLCARFRVEPDEEQAEMYLRFLQKRIDSVQFKAAARMLWATREFFPRPVDFLTADEEREWRLVLNAVYASGEERVTLYRSLSNAALEAIASVGGIEALARSPVHRMRSMFADAYERHCAHEAYEDERRQITAPAQQELVLLSEREGGGTMPLQQYLQEGRGAVETDPDQGYPVLRSVRDAEDV